MRPLSLLLFALVGCSPQAVVRSDSLRDVIGPARKLHVDERAQEGGDGSLAKPFRTLQEALSRPREGRVLIELGSGLYKGPFELDEAVALQGRGGAVVLHSEGEVTLIARGGSLERLMVQGGQVGLRAAGAVKLDQVEFSGQRKAAVEVVSGSLAGSALKFDASVSEIVGLAVHEGTTVKLSASRWTGPYRRGIEQLGGSLSLDGARFDESVIAVHVRAGTAALNKLRIRGGREAAILIGGGKVTLSSSVVEGHEYGLLCGQGCDLELKDFEVANSERAGVALAQAKASIDGLRVYNGGTFAGVQLVKSVVTMKNATITRSTAAGVMINGGQVRVSDSVIEGSSNVDGSSGDGIAARTGTVELQTIMISKVEGAGVLSGNAAEVTANAVKVDGAAHGAFVADFKGKLTATQVNARNLREAAFVAIEGATMSVHEARIQAAPSGLAWVDCASGSTLKLRKITTTIPAPVSACIDAGP